jgi:chitodextrinase
MKIIYKLFPVLLCLAAFNVSAQDPVANYPFSASAEDVTDFKNHASVNAAYLAQDRFGLANNAFSFDGVNSFLAAPNADQLNSDLATVSFWVNVTEIPLQGEAYIISFGGWQERYKISLPSHGKFIWTTNADGISDMDAGDGNEVTVGVWTHMVFVHDGAKDLIYMNGVLANEKDVPGNLNSTTRPLGIGYNIFDGGSYTNGLIDEVQIYDIALSAQQVSDLFAAQSEAPTFAQGVVADYSFSGNLNDSSDYANHARGTDVKIIADRFGFGASANSFDGVSSGVTAENSAQLNSDFTTISFWINVNELPLQGEVYVVSNGGWQERLKISLPAHGKIVFTTNGEFGCCSDMDAGDGNELQVGTWTHVAMVHDGAKDKIFIDGALVNEKDVAGTLNPTIHPLGIGYDPIDVANYFDGALDDVMLFNYGMTDQEVSDLYDAQSTANIDPTNLVADFPFAGDATDVSQFGNNGVIDGAFTMKDRFGYGGNAYRFSGAEGITASNSVAYNSDFASVSFWVNVAELPAQGEVYLLSYGGWQQRWKISLPSHGKPVFTTNGDFGCCSDMDSGDGNELQVGVWTHVVMVHDGLKDKIFMNGDLVNEKDVVGKLNPTGHPFGIGYDPIDVANYFDGALDEVQLYNVGLTDQEVADLYAVQSTPPAPTATLVADYQFGGNALDATEFRNNGQVNGAILSVDRFGRANNSMTFDGVAAGVTADNTVQLNTPEATISFWANVTELPAQGEVYMLSFGGWQERWKISLPAHGKPVFTTRPGFCCSDMDSGDGNELLIGVWTHVAMVHDGAKDKIFMNGDLVNEKDVVGDLDSTAHPLGIGYDPIDVANYFNGRLDDVQLYNFGMTNEEVATLFAAQSVPPADTDTEAPTAPLNVSGDVTNTDIDLSWRASTDNVGVTGYNVSQDGAVIMNTAGAYASISGLEPITDYTFGVTAVDAAGNESIMTTIQLTTGLDAAPDTIPPSKPENLTAATSANSVVFSWDPSTDNVAVAGYIVWVDGILFDSLAADKTSVFVGGLDPLTLYTFEVLAYDPSGNESEIADLTVETDEPIITAEEGLVAHYPFEGNADDITPHENHGVIGGDPVFETVGERPGMAIVFDGDQDSVLAPNAAQLISDYTTVSFWIRVDGQNFQDPEAYILDFGHWDERWKISLPQHLKIVWTTNSKNNVLPNAVSDMDSGDGNELVIGFWWYVTMVHDGEDDIIYIDGEEVNRKQAQGTLNSTARAFRMASSYSGGLYFEGALDEVKVYNKALTAAEVAKLFETGTTSIPFISAKLNKYVDLLYPNPASDRIVIDHNFSGRDDLLIRIFDAQGRQMDTQTIDASELNIGQISWNITDYPLGHYSINFVYGGENLGSIPFIKQ